MILSSKSIKKLKRKNANLNSVLHPELKLKKKQVTSGASRNVTIFKNKIPLQILVKKLTYSKKWNAGRNSSGRIVVRTKGSRSERQRTPFINYSYRLTFVSFISSFILVPYSHKMISLVISSGGSITYTQTSTSHELFRYVAMRSLLARKNKLNLLKNRSSLQSSIYQLFFVLIQLPKNQSVSLIELKPCKGIQYARSTGTHATILKMDTRTSTGLVKLPSKVKKVFSIFSIASLGAVALSDNKKFKNNSAGYQSRFGKKCLSRGVAKNPVDHPHGGRAKAIRYQRTPWGKTTKKK